MSKMIAIARRYIYTTFKDFNLLLIMFAAPLMISTIIALAFSGVSSGASPISNIPVAVVNLDKGADVMGTVVNNGDILMNVLIPPTTEPDSATTTPPDETCAPLLTSTTSEQQGGLDNLISAVRIADVDLARSGVEDGSYAVAVIIPENFSQSITYTGPNFTFNPVQIEIYGDGNRSISAGIVRSIVEGVNNSILAGNITFATFYQTLIVTNPVLALNAQAFNTALACAFNPSVANLSVNTQSITGETAGQFNALVSIGASLAGFFALFTASGAATNILEERRNGTLQRMMVSPTPRTNILIGMLMGTFAVVLLQLVFLFIALTIINSGLQGQFTFIWGANWIAIIGMLLVTSLSVSGVGIFIASLSKTSEQSSIFGSIVSTFMGVLGGAFFNVDALPEAIQPITRLSIVRWSTEGFTRLSVGNTDILLNLLWLLILGGVLFVAGTIIFARRQDI
ncbi:MAG: ABC transporter permease [Anaerolineae bacterium]|nr:ABC transporter permease [Anaerolineae bacterium]